MLSPVVTRLLIYGINPFDLEQVLQRIEGTPLRSARQLETRWLEEWETLARAWETRGQASPCRPSRDTARRLAFQSAGCRLAQFLINPSSLEQRKERYRAFARSYRSAADHFESPVLSVEIPLGGRSALSAHLHLPVRSPPHPCVAIFSGLGSCKEEMHTLARLMVERGVAALVPDMPGSGETLFEHRVPCNSDHLSSAFRAVADFVEHRPELDAAHFGASGLCMGGGYAYRACSEDQRYGWCATLFPLFINEVDDDRTPQWMKSGEWYDFQTGGQSASALREGVGWRDSFAVSCPFFMIHGRHDNWMTLDRARRLYDHAASRDRHLLVVDESAVYSSGQAVTHTMPVGEQMGWVGPILADWVASRARVRTESEACS